MARLLTPEHLRGMWAEGIALARNGPPYEPRNTISNAAYPVAAVVASLLWPSPNNWMFVLSMLWLGIGSAAYHAYKNRFTNQLDWSGMLCVLGALIGNGLDPTDRMGGTLVGIVVGAGMAFIWPLMHVNAVLAMGGVAAIVGPLVRDPITTIPFLFAAVFTFASAYTFWKADRALGSDLARTRLLAAEPHKLWGHAYWHILTALTFALLWGAGVMVT